jgi:DNA-binding MarR family transcriptional regulator
MEIEQAYPYLMERAMRRMRQVSHAAFAEAGLDITVEQWVVLYIIFEGNGLSQVEITELAFKDAPTVTRIIDNLVKKSWVYRQMSEADRRKFEIYATTEGKALVEKLLPIVMGIRAEGICEITESDLRVFKRVLSRLYSNFDSHS